MNEYDWVLQQSRKSPYQKNIMNHEELHEIVEQEVGVGRSFDNTQELHTITFNNAMKSLDKEKWAEAIKKEYNKMNKYDISSLFLYIKLKEMHEFCHQKGNEKEGKWELQGMDHSKRLQTNRWRTL